MGTRIRQATLPEIPFQRETHGHVRVAFRRLNLPDQAFCVGDSELTGFLCDAR